MIKIIGVVIGLLMLFLLLGGEKVFEPQDNTDCDIQKGACIKKLSGDIVAEFDITPKPVKTMTPETFIVRLKKSGTPVRDAAVTLDLRMLGMQMGVNKTVLPHKKDGTYEGSAIIVRCPSGRKIWGAYISADIPQPDKPLQASASYIFKVAR